MGTKGISFADIERRRRELESELADLAATERVMRSMSGAPAPTPLLDAPRNEGKFEAKKRILGLLKDSEKGLSYQEVIKEIRRRWVPDYNEKNVSPKLSFYKAKGWVELANGIWRITQLGLKELL